MQTTHHDHNVYINVIISTIQTGATAEPPASQTLADRFSFLGPAQSGSACHVPVQIPGSAQFTDLTPAGFPLSFYNIKNSKPD